MQLSAVLLARVLGYIEVFDLSPRGKVFLPEIVPEIVKKYQFQKYPKTPEEFDEAKGIEFHEGRFEGKVIQKFVIWNSLLVLETRSDTADSRIILEDMLMWGAAELGLYYKRGMLKRFAYVSSLTFHTDVPILKPISALTSLAERVSKEVSEVWQEPIHYETSSINIGHDPLARKYGIASFTITRRAEARLADNKYFSEAPLPTGVHLKLLEQYEKDTIETQRSWGAKDGQS